MTQSPAPRRAVGWRSPALLALIFTLLFSTFSFAADPATATINPNSPNLIWNGTSLGPVNPAPQLGEEQHDALCVDVATCDSFVLKVSGTPGEWAGKKIQVRLGWNLPASDYDMYVHRGSATGPVVARGTSGLSTFESDSIDPSIQLAPDANGITEFHVHVIYFTGGPADQYRGSIVIDSGIDTTVTLAPVDTGATPRYQNYIPTQEQMAAGMTKNASDEPSIGVNWNTGNVMFQAMLQTLRLKFNDASCKQSPSCSWVDKTPVTSTVTSFDPILFTDPKTGRTQVNQLLFNPIAQAASYSDDDGDTWIVSQGSGVGSGVDHQTIGGGPLHAPVPTGAGYAHGVYYCSQDIALANCALSLDGGRTYGPAVPIYDLRQCAGLHGHVKVAPDGTAYVPNSTCSGRVNEREQAVVVSEDNGITWQVRTVPGSLAGDGSDPSVAIDETGRIYLGYSSGDKLPAVAVSEDKGRTWGTLHDVGTMAGVKYSVFPAAIAGGNGRAAIAFYGTGDVDGNAVPSDFRFNGLWHLYIAHTYDAGKSWITVNATPNDPLQRGGLHLGGGGPIHRNLLDFFDASTDQAGNVLVGYADGCVGPCVQAPVNSRGNSYIAFGTVARQTGGRRLFAASDSTAATAPGAPRTTVTRNGSVANISWSLSENGGLTPTGFEVRRKAGSGAEQLLASLGGDAFSYSDTSADASTTYSYRVVAKNALGASCGENEVTSAPAGSSCIRPGVRVVTDKGGDQRGAPLNPDQDIEWISIAEPFYEDGTQKLEFTMKVASLASMPANRMWRIVWRYPDGPGPSVTSFSGRYYVGMNTDSNGVASFEYGIQESLVAVLADAAPALRLGAADASSSVSPDGTIRIVIANDKIGSPKAGDLIGGLLARAYPVYQGETLRSDSASDSVSLGDDYKLVGNAACEPKVVVTCFEEKDKAVNYDSGWHTVASSSASGGQFRYRNGNSANALSFTFNVANGSTGSLDYHYATSLKGGSADVYIDGTLKGSINFNGTSGTHRAPVFGASASYGGLSAGSHTFELRNVKGAAFVDRFCLSSASFTSTATAGPGNTNSTLQVLAPAQELAQSVVVASGTQSISAVAEGAAGSTLKIVLVSPSGSVLNMADSVNGVATLNAPVSATGTYILKVVNTSLASQEVWTVTTPWGNN